MKYHYLFPLLLLLLAACGGSTSTEANQNKKSGFPEIDVWTERIEKTPNDSTLYIGRFNAAMQIDQHDQAIEDAKKLIGLDSTRVTYYRMLADAYFEKNDSRQALKTLEIATQRFPDDLYTQLSLAEMHMIVSQYEQARIALDNILKVDPYHTGALYMLGQLAKEQADTATAMRAFQAVVETDANHHDAYIQLGKLADRLNNPLALQYLQNALRIDSTSRVALMSLAQYYHQRGDFDQAIEWYQRAVTHHPLNGDVQYNMGLLYIERGDNAKDKTAQTELWKKALKHFENATKFDVHFGDAYYYVGLCHEKLGDLTNATRQYENAVRIGEELGQAKAALERLQKK
mgnify:CR=1 FL=1